MHSDTRTQATMLLTATLGRSDRSGVKPLSIREWARFAVWLKDQELEPASLLKCDLASVLSGWADRSITVPRLEELLGRGGALGLALERWQRAGLWVMTRSDPEYPRRLKERLGQESPPVCCVRNSDTGTRKTTRRQSAVREGSITSRRSLLGDVGCPAKAPLTKASARQRRTHLT